MSVIKLVEDYAIATTRRDVRDSLMMAGEECIVLQLYHAGDADAIPCPQCGDDVYKSPEENCSSCFGTMFDRGVRMAMRTWAMFTDKQVPEQIGPRGVYRPDQRSVQLEAFPWVTEHDVIVRIREWDAQHTPLQVEGFYVLQAVTRDSLRTGNRFGQWTTDVVGQKAQLSELPATMSSLTKNYPIVGVTFEESIVLVPQGPNPNIVVQPDVKVVYYPFKPGLGGVDPEATGGIVGVNFVFEQNTPASVWTINHNLGFEPDVSIVVGGEEVEADVDYPNDNTVVLTFAIPTAGVARLT